VAVDIAREIEILVRAKYPILYLVSWEERRVEQAIQPVAKSLNRTLHTWTITQGAKPPISRTGIAKPTTLSPELEILAQIYDAPEGTIFLLRDFHPYMKDFRVIRLLRDLAIRIRSKTQTLILTGPVLTLPSDLEKDICVLDFPLPDAEDIGDFVDSVIASVKSDPKVDVQMTPLEREKLVKAAQGLTLDEIESTFARSLVEFRTLKPDAVVREKRQIIRKSGLLEYYEPDAELRDVGGMEMLKEWLEKRTESFTDRAKEFGIPSPKGILLLGVQGCGKSLTAKAVAAQWNLPLLRLDVGRIFDGSLVGLTEKNMRSAIATAESIAPCILWMDELEKGFGGLKGSGDSGTTSRTFATFLTWMSEKTAPVFLVATANDVSQLPPEMLRKGRFDEIFFVDLPGLAEREEIFRIHLTKRKRDTKKFKLKALAEATDGFSGAEIEQVVVGGLYLAFADGRGLAQKDLIAEAKNVVPLSVMMSEDIAELREWASLRTRPASKNDD